jgi:hypothetical protein
MCITAIFMLARLLDRAITQNVLGAKTEEAQTMTDAKGHSLPMESSLNSLHSTSRCFFSHLKQNGLLDDLCLNPALDVP